MRTSQNISGIIWTSSKYCNDILDKLVEKGLVSWWAFIRHKAESSDGDEQSGRDHIHCYITPSKILDTDILANCWDEVTDDGLHLGAGRFGVRAKPLAIGISMLFMTKTILQTVVCFAVIITTSRMLCLPTDLYCSSKSPIYRVSTSRK